MLSFADNHVCIVDTSNEICGDSDVPHPAVSFSRQFPEAHLNQRQEISVTI